MKNSSRKIFTLILLTLFPLISRGQCAMCRAVLESGDNNAVAEGINNGIVYLMAIPYILVGVIFYMVYRKMRTPKAS
jgi:hypothetical protein